MATKYTIESGEYSKLIKKYKPRKIIGIIGTQCEREVSHGTYRSAAGKRNIKDELYQYEGKMIDTVILSCTCFKTISAQIKNVLGDEVVCLDPALEISELSKKILNINKNKANKETIVYNTVKNKELMNNLKKICNANMSKTTKVNFLKLER